MSSWRLNRGWASGELCSHRDGTVEARLPFAIQRAGLRADIIGNDMVVAIIGTLETRPSWHPVRLNGQHLRVVAQFSAAAHRRHQLLDTIRNDGRLTAQQRLQLPDAAITVRLVTSAGSAALADITATFTAARTPVRLLEEHATLTGPNAPTSVAAAITPLGAARPDLIIIARGAGATTELATFDSEAVTTAIAAAPIQIITAIEHATDTTVADHVAHTHVPTPTAAATRITAGHQRRRQAEENLAANRRLEAARAQAVQAQVATERAARQRRLALVALAVALLDGGLPTPPSPPSKRLPTFDAPPSPATSTPSEDTANSSSNSPTTPASPSASNN